MVLIEGTRYVGTPLGRQLLPTSIPHQDGYDRHGHRSPLGTPTFSYLYEKEDHHHGKKSILMKVKEKAKKWRQILTRKRHGNDGSDKAMPPWGVSLDETDVEDPEYHGAPMYESEMAQDPCKCQASQKQATCQLHCADKKSMLHEPTTMNKELEMKEANDSWKPSAHNNLRPIREKPMFEIRALSLCCNNNSQQEDKPVLQIPAFFASTSPLREKITEMVTPAYVMISDATRVIATKIQESRPGCEMIARQVWCRSVSMKDTLMQKLQPKEEDKALCQVITEVVSPRSGIVDHNKEVGVIEKVKEAMSSMMAKEESHISSMSVSTNPFADDGERDLQAHIS